MKRAAVLLITLLSGCDLYWNHSGGGDDTICPDKEPAQPAIRDPSTGNCFVPPSGGGDCEPTDDGCGCAYPVASAPSEIGAYCSGECESLGELSCVTTAGCHAEYGENEILPDVTDNNGGQVQFIACWDIQPLTPLEGGGCAQLDSVGCSMHDDCISIMDSTTAGAGSFIQCADVDQTPPPDSCDGVDCGAGSTCETQCYPCDPSDASTGCMSSCSPVCVPLTKCDTVCNPGYTCGEACDSNGTCSDACYPNGGGSGSAGPACETLTDAMSCDARNDCTPVYTGMNCTCDANGACTCESETYARCESIDPTTPQPMPAN